MTATSSTSIYNVEAVLVTVLVAGYAIFWLIRSLARSRPGLDLTKPIAAAFLVRMFGAAVVSLLSFGQQLRGGDEVAAQNLARSVSNAAVGSPSWLDVLTNGTYPSGLHILTFAGQYKLIDSPEFALRAFQIGIATTGIVLLACAVYELAGSRAATVSAWILAFEPASIFFSGLLHKEALLVLAEGLVVWGAACLWQRGRTSYAWVMGLGCLVALGTRPYVGWFLIAGSLAIMVHAAARVRGDNARRSATLIALVALVAVLGAPFAVQKSSSSGLKDLQVSQTANANDTSNLKLEQVSYSTRSDLVLALPRRIRDVLVRPYPWQMANASQALGLFGTLFALGLLGLLAQVLWRSRGTIMERAGPLVYVGGTLLITYALSVGNAGTGFRYRTHIVAIGICLTVVLRERRAELAAESLPQRASAPSVLVSAS